MKTFAERLELTRQGGTVKRSHTNFIHQPENNAEHTYNMLNIILILHPNPSVDLIKAASWHDVPERFTGDIPSPAKRLFPKLKEASLEAEKRIAKQFNFDVVLSDDELNWLKAADKLEYMMHCAEEIARGNAMARVRMDRVKEDILTNNATPPQIREFAENYRHNPSNEIIL